MIDHLIARLRSLIADRLTAVAAKNDDGQWGVAVLHGGRRTHWLSPAQARKDALKLLDLANLACRPGECPDGGDLDGGSGGIFQRRRVG